MSTIDGVNGGRVDDHLAHLDETEAAGWLVPRYEWPRPFPMRGGLPRMDMAAADEWRDAWRRGLVSDPEMAWYLLLINYHPYSWLGWLRGGTGEWS